MANISGGLSGAASGASIGSAIPGIGTAIGAGLGGLFGLFGGGNGPDPDELQRQLEQKRQQSKQAQFALLDQQMTPMMQNRIKALNDQSQAGPLATDPYFQGQRALAVQGGQQALSGVQNVNRAQGISGGFSNTGSINDVYDRLGGQLADLGGQSAALKDQKAQQAAELQQNFQNYQTQARMAIESGDYQAAQQALQAAFDTKQKIADAANQNQSSVLGGLAKTAGALNRDKVAAPSSNPAYGGKNQNVTGLGQVGAVGQTPNFAAMMRLAGG